MGKLIITVASFAVLALVASSCVKDLFQKGQMTYELTTFEYESKSKPDAAKSLKSEIETLCSESTGKDQSEVGKSLKSIIAKYTTSEYVPFSYHVVITGTRGESHAYIIQRTE